MPAPSQEEIEASGKPMTATERKELRNIIKGEFEVLKSELQVRAEELKREAVKAVEDEHAHLLTEANKAGTKINTEIKKSLERIRKIEEDFLAKGVEPAGKISRYDYDYDDELKTHSVGVKQYSKWQPVNLEEAKQNAAREIQVKHSQALVQLQRREVDLNKQLSLNALHSDTAINFLNLIPTAQEMLYLDHGQVVLAELPVGVGG